MWLLDTVSGSGSRNQKHSKTAFPRAPIFALARPGPVPHGSAIFALNLGSCRSLKNCRKLTPSPWASVSVCLSVPVLAGFCCYHLRTNVLSPLPVGCKTPPNVRPDASHAAALNLVGSIKVSIGFSCVFSKYPGENTKNHGYSWFKTSSSPCTWFLCTPLPSTPIFGKVWPRLSNQSQTHVWCKAPNWNTPCLAMADVTQGPISWFYSGKTCCVATGAE